MSTPCCRGLSNSWPVFVNFGSLTEKLVDQAGRSRGRLKKVLQIKGWVVGIEGLEIQALPEMA